MHLMNLWRLSGTMTGHLQYHILTIQISFESKIIVQWQKQMTLTLFIKRQCKIQNIPQRASAASAQRLKLFDLYCFSYSVCSHTCLLFVLLCMRLLLLFPLLSCETKVCWEETSRSPLIAVEQFDFHVTR